jgi:aryl-alcohol dehydrogenase
MKITAAVAHAPDTDFRIEALELDDPRDDELLVRIVGVGVCHTDLVARAGALPIALPAVLGHEGSGIVERVGAGVTKVAPGDRVAITFQSCGRCSRCTKRDPAYCINGLMLNLSGARPDGSKALHGSAGDVSSHFFGQSSFATHCLAQERNVVKVPADIPLEMAGPLGCGVQTGVGAVMRSLGCAAGSSILILGGGAVGLSAVLGAVVQECRTIIVLEPHEARRALARELGATHALDPAATPDLAAAVRGIAPEGVDYALETTGIPAIVQAAMACLGAHAVFGIVGLPPPETPIPGDLFGLIVGGLTIKGIVEGDSEPDVFIPQMMDLHRAGKLPYDRLIRTYPFTHINEAIAAQHNGECVKVVLLVE